MSDTWVENEQYQLVPGNNDHWNIRILEGEFVETVISFSKLVVSDDGEHLTFNCEVVETPMDDLDPDTNVDFQQTAGKILSAILETAVVDTESK